MICGLIPTSGGSIKLYGKAHTDEAVRAKMGVLIETPSCFPSLTVFDNMMLQAAKQKAWLAICGSLGGGMLLFMTVSIITPLSSTFINVILCLVGGLAFAFGLGAISKVILKKTSLV